jgi:ABC-type nitrate/sulfonate/bicarbonate transport system substrate-binding protein
MQCIIRLALDWTPNTNHTGFFVSLAKGWYREAGLHVQISSPADDGYATTPARQLAAGVVDLAIAPTESVISLQRKAEPVPAIAIAALLQEDTSAIVTLASGDITRPAQLEGKVYASYQARYEDYIVKQILVNDGAKPDLQIVYPDKLGIWNTLLSGQADATWIFRGWEGVEAETQGLALNYFQLSDWHIPYGYSPVLIGIKPELEARRGLYRSFLEVSRRGFLYAIENPAEAAELLAVHLSERDRECIDLLKSQQWLNQYYTRNGRWGYMEASTGQQFLDWLAAQQLIESSIAVHSIYDNSYLPL